jgi:hypothetical protein
MGSDKKTSFPILICVLLLVFALDGEAFAQIDRDVARYCYSAIARNILTFVSSENVKSWPRGFSDYFVSPFCPLLDTGEYYNVSFKYSDIGFPDGRYRLIEFSTDRMAVYRPVHDSLRERLSVSAGGDIVGYSPLLDKGLIALGNRSLLFVSGYMFLHDVRRYYFDGGYDSVKISSYLLVRYFNYDPEIISVDAKSGSAVFFSKVLHMKYLLRINYGEDEKAEVLEHI